MGVLSFQLLADGNGCQDKVGVDDDPELSFFRCRNEVDPFVGNNNKLFVELIIDGTASPAATGGLGFVADWSASNSSDNC